MRDWNKILNQEAQPTQGRDWNKILPPEPIAPAPQPKEVKPIKLWEPQRDKEKDKKYILSPASSKLDAPKAEEKKPISMTRLKTAIQEQDRETLEKDFGLNPDFAIKYPQLTQGVKNVTDLVNAPIKFLENKLPVLQRIREVGANRQLMSDDIKPVDTGSKVGNVVGDIAGTIAGYAMPLPGNQISLLQGANQLSQPVAQKVTEKLGTDLGGRLATGFAREATEGATLGTLEGLARGEKGKTLAKRVATETLIGGALGAGFEGVSKIAGDAIKKGKLEKIQLKTNTELGLPKDMTPNAYMEDMKKLADEIKGEQSANQVEAYYKSLEDMVKAEEASKLSKAAAEEAAKAANRPKGTYKTRNVALEKAVNEYNNAIDIIQNHFKTNELRSEELQSIKSVLGIDLDNLVENVRKAEQGIDIAGIGKRNELGIKAGAIEPPKLKPLDKPKLIEPTLKPKVQDTLKSSVSPLKSLNNSLPLPTNKKPLEPILKPRDNITGGLRETAATTDTVRTSINRNPKVKKASFDETTQKLRTQFVDDLAALEGLEKSVKGKVGSAEESLYKKARLYKGTPEKALAVVDTELKPIIKEIEGLGYDYKDLGDYAVAIHAKDVNAAGLNSGFTEQQIENTIRQYGAPEMEAARQKLVGLSNKLVNDLVDSGVIAKETAEAMKNKWGNYMPLFRSFDDDKIEFSRGIRESFSNVANPIKKLEGSDREVIDPIESMVKNIYKMTSAADRNRVGLELAKLADLDTTSTLVRRLADGEEVGRKNVVGVWQNGKKVQYEVQPDVYKAMNDLNRESSNLLIKMLSKPASILRAGATLTPEFAVRNPYRDVKNAFIFSKSGFNPVVDFPRALANVIRKDDIYYQWLKDSGGYGNMLSMDRKAHREALERIIKEPDTQKFVNIVNPKKWLDFMRAVSDATESATKLGEYKAALRSGTSRAEAAYRSRDLMDFARAGSSIRPANRIVAFLNANIQGKSKIIRAMQEDPARVTAKAAITMGLPAIGFFALQEKFSNERQRELIDNAPDWLKNTFWLVPVPGTNQVARIPKPFDFAVISNTIENFLAYTIKNDKEAFDNFVGNTLKEQSIPVMLTGIAPIIEGMTNYSFFRQSPIVPRREEYLRQEDQFDINTSELSKGIARGLRPLVQNSGMENFGSPRIVDNTLRSMTGGLGNYALDAVDVILGATGITDKKEKPAKTVSQLPVLKSFLVNENQSSKSLDYLYKEKDKLTAEKGSNKLRNEKLGDSPKLKFINAELEKISDLSKEIREVTNSTKLDKDEKAQQIKRLIDQRNRIATSAEKSIKERWGN